MNPDYVYVRWLRQTNIVIGGKAVIRTPGYEDFISKNWALWFAKNGQCEIITDRQPHVLYEDRCQG